MVITGEKILRHVSDYGIRHGDTIHPLAIYSGGAPQRFGRLRVDNDLCDFLADMAGLVNSVRFRNQLRDARQQFAQGYFVTHRRETMKRGAGIG